MFEDLKQEWELEDKRHTSARGRILMKALRRKDESGKAYTIYFVAKEFGLSNQDSVSIYLDAAAVVEAAGGTSINLSTGVGGNTTKAISELMKIHRPDVPSEEYVNDYRAEGYGQKTAERLATAYEATENAIAAGHVVESMNKANEKVASIALPAGVDWSIKLRKAMTYLNHAANILDQAKINDLRRDETSKRVCDANKKWMEQMERIENFHPRFME